MTLKSIDDKNVWNLKRAPDKVNNIIYLRPNLEQK